MSTVLYVGMDVHSTSYSLATFALGDREVRFELKIEPDYEQVLQYLGTVRRQVADALGEVEFVCGYQGVSQACGTQGIARALSEPDKRTRACGDFALAR